ncbi:MAG TPA: hypothetical protein VN922_03420 [Bacteroidia bacterium]|nr:hypothetical protein [Bacteroidia bacterium]
MNKKLLRRILFGIALLCTSVAFSQPPPPPPPPSPCCWPTPCTCTMPINSGVVILIAIGLFYGIYTITKSKKKTSSSF